MNRIILTMAAIAITSFAAGQSVGQFMESVGANHPALLAARHQMESSEALSRTGNTPDNPTIAAGWFPGNSEAPGNKITWSISQSLSFPTHYVHMKSLTKASLEAAGMEYYSNGYGILSEARSMAIRYIGLQGGLLIAEERLERAKRLTLTYSELLRNGSATMIEFNRIKLNEAMALQEAESIRSELAGLTGWLNMVSGQNCSRLDGALLPLREKILFDTLAVALEQHHPSFIMPELEIGISEHELQLARTESLPSFEVGYESEIVVNERFTGPSLGMTLPLWKNHGRVKYAEAERRLKETIAYETRSRLLAQYRSTCNSYNSAVERLGMIREAISSADNRELLDLSLAEGEISLAEYLVELSYLNDLEDLELELLVTVNLLWSELSELEFYHYL